MYAYAHVHARDFGATFRCRGQTLAYIVKCCVEKTFVVDQQVQRGLSRSTLSALLLGNTSGGTVKLLFISSLVIWFSFRGLWFQHCVDLRTPTKAV